MHKNKYHMEDFEYEEESTTHAQSIIQKRIIKKLKEC
jgi:hypothetical protein